MVGLLALPGAAGALSLLGATPAGEGADVLPPSLLPENAPSEAARDSLARIMVAEAAGEGTEGMQAVGNVVWNRMHNTHPTLGFKNQDTIQKVIEAENQFAGYKEWHKKDNPIFHKYKNAHESTMWQQAKILAAQQLMNNVEDLAEGMVFYRNPDAPGQDDSEAWFQKNYLAGKLIPTKKIGRHIFYRWDEEGTPDTFIPEALVNIQKPPAKPEAPEPPVNVF